MTEPDLTDPACACSTLRKATRAMTRLYDEALAPAGVTIAQFSVLRHIARDEGAPLSRLAEALVMDRTSLYRALAPLEKQGWIAIAATSGRIKTASLTEAGRATIARARVRWDAMQARVLGEYGTAQWALLEGGLHKITTVAAGAAA